MNPPFHRGRAAEPEIGAGMIRAAAKALKPGGRLFMVANRQLPYETVLAAVFSSHGEIAREGTVQGVLGAALSALTLRSQCRLATRARGRRRIRTWLAGSSVSGPAAEQIALNHFAAGRLQQRRPGSPSRRPRR